MWLHVPPGFCPSAPATGASTSDADWRSRMLASSVARRGKPMPPKGWLRSWNKASWTKRLFGRISEPSTAALGVERWIASLVAIPASHFPPPASGSGPKTPGTSGRESAGSSPRYARSGAFSRTSLDTYRWDLKPSRTTSKDWATRLRRACSAREKSVRLSFGGGCSLWPTPKEQEDGASVKATLARKSRARAKYDRGEYAKGCGPPSLNSLSFAVQMWATPTSHERTLTPRKVHHGEQLANQVAMWSTPRASPNENRQTRPSPSQLAGEHGMNLATQAATFPSSLPDQGWVALASSMTFESFSEKTLEQLGSAIERNLPTHTDGGKSSPSTRSLSPLFVE